VKLDIVPDTYTNTCKTWLFISFRGQCQVNNKRCKHFWSSFEGQQHICKKFQSLHTTVWIVHYNCNLIMQNCQLHGKPFHGSCNSYINSQTFLASGNPLASFYGHQSHIFFLKDCLLNESQTADLLKNLHPFLFHPLEFTQIFFKLDFHGF
jgi:hypothetical protein